MFVCLWMGVWMWVFYKGNLFRGENVGLYIVFMMEILFLFLLVMLYLLSYFLVILYFLNKIVTVEGYGVVYNVI